LTIATSGSSTTFPSVTFSPFLKSKNHLPDSFRPHYVNYEVLCNAFSTKIIDLSKAEIYRIKNTEMTRDELETFLEEENQYTI